MTLVVVVSMQCYLLDNDIGGMQSHVGSDVDCIKLPSYAVSCINMTTAGDLQWYSIIYSITV